MYQRKDSSPVRLEITVISENIVFVQTGKLGWEQIIKGLESPSAVVKYGRELYYQYNFGDDVNCEIKWSHNGRRRINKQY